MLSNWSKNGLKWFEICSRRVKRFTLAGPSGARPVPPYPRTPPKHIPWRTVTQTKMQTYGKIHTHTRT
jgi:hypothetical protein